MNFFTDTPAPAADSATELKQAGNGLRAALEHWLQSLDNIDAERELLRHRLCILILTLGQPGQCPSCQKQIFWMTTADRMQVPYDPDGQGHFHAGGVS